MTYDERRRSMTRLLDRIEEITAAGIRGAIRDGERLAEAQREGAPVAAWTDKQKQRILDEIERQAGGVTPVDVRPDDPTMYTAYFPKSDKGELATYRVAEAYKGAARRGWSPNMGMFYVTITHR